MSILATWSLVTAATTYVFGAGMTAAYLAALPVSGDPPSLKLRAIEVLVILLWPIIIPVAFVRDRLHQ